MERQRKFFKRVFDERLLRFGKLLMCLSKTVKRRANRRSTPGIIASYAQKLGAPVFPQMFQLRTNARQCARLLPTPMRGSRLRIDASDAHIS